MNHCPDQWGKRHSDKGLPARGNLSRRYRIKGATQRGRNVTLCGDRGNTATTAWLGSWYWLQRRLVALVSRKGVRTVEGIPVSHALESDEQQWGTQTEICVP